MRAAPFSLTAFLLLMLCGCAGYRLGPTNPEQTAGKSVQVNLFENKTLEPRLAEAVTQALRKSLQQDGAYKLSTHNDGDVIVTGTILNYSRQGVSFQPNDLLTIRDYQLALTVHVTATERPARSSSTAKLPDTPPPGLQPTCRAPNGRRCRCWPRIWPKPPPLSSWKVPGSRP
jgi:Lipopolysaccharide-assembly